MKLIAPFALIACVSCTPFGGAPTIDGQNSTGFSKELEAHMKLVRQEAETLPFKGIKWENMINPGQFGAIKDIYSGYDSLYIETADEQKNKRYLIVLDRKTNDISNLVGGQTRGIIILYNPLRWQPVENPPIPQEMDELRTKYRIASSEIDKLIRSDSEDQNLLKQLKAERRKNFELLSLKAKEDNFYIVAGTTLFCYQRSSPLKLKWSTDPYFVIGTQPYASGEYSFVGGIKFSRIFMYNVNSGELAGDLRPTLTRQNRILFPPVADIPNVFFASEDRFLSAFNITNPEKPIWKFELGGDPTTPPVMAKFTFKFASVTKNEKAVILGCSDSSLYAVNAFSGLKMWQYRCESEPDDRPVLLSNNTVLVHTKNGYLTNVDLYPAITDERGENMGVNSLGKFNWKVPAKRFLLETKNHLFTETSDGSLRQIDKATGQIIHDFKPKLLTGFVVNPYDNYLYLYSKQGAIVALSDD